MSWPDRAEAKAWIGSVPADHDDIVDGCLEAAIEWLVQHTVWRRNEDPSATTRMACLLLTARLYRRKQSPEGIAQFGDEGAIRVYAVDADVHALIAPDRPVLMS